MMIVSGLNYWSNSRQQLECKMDQTAHCCIASQPHTLGLVKRMALYLGTVYAFSSTIVQLSETVQKIQYLVLRN